MPKRTDLKKIMVIGSGPIVIGQASEFDYAGTQACIALKEEGYEVILVNSNPATIMTDTDMATKVYMEPLDLEHVAKILRYERPDGLICNMGGQTALNLGMSLYTKGILEECQVELLGTSFDSIQKAEDRQIFKDLCIKINEPVLLSNTTSTIEESINIASSIGYPVIIRPAFTLGGTGGGFANSRDELIPLVTNALALSSINQVLIEKSIKGFKEIEFEVIRDKQDTSIVICSMENVDPVGIHTGDSIVVAPTQTLTNYEYQMLSKSAIKIIKALGIEGGCNVQFALDPYSFSYYVIEVNPRVSRSSALASKASGYPIARVSTKIACGYLLEEIDISGNIACKEPVLDYVVLKFPRFPFDKFTNASRKLHTQMKATGEVMSIGRSLEEALLKSIRSLELGLNHLELPKLKNKSVEELLEFIQEQTDETIFAIAEALRKNVEVSILNKLSKIDELFINVIKNIVDFEKEIKNNIKDINVLKEAKRKGFSDSYIGSIWNLNNFEMFELRKKLNILPTYKKIDGCSRELNIDIPYLYSTYEVENESKRSNKEKVIVLGSGPIRIGQGVEFDYSTVHAIWAINKLGFEAIIINNNPETVSTDYTLTDKLYFEPLTYEDVVNIIDYEKPIGVIVALGGQTAINLASELEKSNINILGTTSLGISKTEDRNLFTEEMNKLGINIPVGKGVFTLEEAIQVANNIKFPVLIRPSFVLGGKMMHIVYDEVSLKNYVKEAFEMDSMYPVLIDKYISGIECEVDAICDGENVFIPGIIEHIEKSGVHSGDSMSVYPPYSITSKLQEKIVEYTTKIGLGLNMIGLYNIQFIITKDEELYVIEVNPRSSRTVPFIAKVTNVLVSQIATQVILGKKLKDLGYIGIYPKKKRWFVKSPTFSYSKITGLDAVLSPEMKSTGEAIGYDDSLNRALYKSMKASGLKVSNYGTILATISDKEKELALPLIKRFYDLGFNIEATSGTFKFLKENGIKARLLNKISVGSKDIISSLSKGHVTYVINTTTEGTYKVINDGVLIRKIAVEHNIPVFTSLDTVNVLLNALEEITLGISVINKE